MSSERLFHILSYLTVLGGFLSLWISGVFGMIGTLIFLVAFFGGWFLEQTKWQISERIGTALIVLALPAYFGLARAGFFAVAGSESDLPGILARLIVTLSAIKILQRKSDRDWIFLYIMSFFEVLLAAGLSISALYLTSFVAYVFVTVCTIILFEIRKAKRSIDVSQLHKQDEAQPPFPSRRIPATAITLIIFIVAIATPLFFVLPRVGSAGFGANVGGGAETSSGFSEKVRLGGTGQIQQNDQVIMRVQLESLDREKVRDIRWRGIALDTFDNLSWRKSRPGIYDQNLRGDRELIQVDSVRRRENLVMQTVYLEPINSSVLFVLSRAVAIQGGTPAVLRDPLGSLSFPPRSSERVSYRVVSDTTMPASDELRGDGEAYVKEFGNYLQLPDDLDPRIAELALEVTKDSDNRYDAAMAVETYLRTQFGYTLDQKSGGDQPLADFLFNVREGHCEYFSTAMAVMLRTQGIATRVVNGFQRGEFNETADVFVVRQKNAHSWVEVYFPGENAWVTFDPTPAAGQGQAVVSSGIVKRMNNYLEALEMFWIQYFVAYDSAEQRSLFASVKQGVSGSGMAMSSFIDSARERILDWWRIARGDEGLRNSIQAVGIALGVITAIIAIVLTFVGGCRRIARSRLWRSLLEKLYGTGRESIVEFYERMLRILAGKGMVRESHQTPLEFAYAAGVPEAIQITEKYNRVRFGDKKLSATEAGEINAWLDRLESGEIAQ